MPLDVRGEDSIEGAVSPAARIGRPQTGPPVLSATFLVPPILIVAGLLANGRYGTISVGQCLGYVALGVFFWTFAEYVLHRFAFHVDIPGIRGLRARHEGHHVDFTTALVSSPGFARHLFPIVIPLRLLFHAWVPAFFCLSGTVLGYCAYEIVHCLIHSNRRGSFVLRRLRRHHLRHHRHTDCCFGLTSPLWDLVLRTGMKRA